MRHKYYLKEFQYFNGEDFVTFNIVDLNSDRKTITVVESYQGKVSVKEYDLMTDTNGYYFEYGCEYKKISVNDFKEEEVEEEKHVCRKDSKLYCQNCKFFTQCDRANVCMGDCGECDIVECENNPQFSGVDE